MIKPFKLPKGVLDIFVIGEADVITISDSNDHRPDLILKDIHETSIGGEIMNNNMSLVSPISCTKGKEYLILGQLFKSCFRK